MSGIYCMNDGCRAEDGQILENTFGFGDGVQLIFRCAHCGGVQRMDIDRYNELVNPEFWLEDEEDEP